MKEEKLGKQRAAPSVALVEDVEDLRQALVDEVMNPRQRVVGQRYPQRLHAGVDLVHAQVAVAQKTDVVLRRVEPTPVFLFRQKKEKKRKTKQSRARFHSSPIPRIPLSLHWHPNETSSSI